MSDTTGPEGACVYVCMCIYIGVYNVAAALYNVLARRQPVDHALARSRKALHAPVINREK